MTRPPHIAELEELKTQLEHANLTIEAQRTAFEGTVRELEEAVRARDEFISIAGHELRNPMGAIVLHVQTLLLSLRKPGGLSQAQLEDKVSAIHRQVDRFVKRASILLDVSRSNLAKIELERETTNFAEVTRNVLESLALEAARGNVVIETHLQDDVVARWDPVALEQVVFNLVSNAVKYGAGAPIEVRLAQEADWAILVVRDRGIGISIEDRERIFDKFERAVKRRHHGGFGMGLWIVRQLVVAHRGSIQVHSQPEEGSTFVVRLPVGETSTRENDGTSD